MGDLTDAAMDVLADMVESALDDAQIEADMPLSRVGMQVAMRLDRQALLDALGHGDCVPREAFVEVEHAYERAARAERAITDALGEDYDADGKRPNLGATLVGKLDWLRDEAAGQRDRAERAERERDQLLKWGGGQDTAIWEALEDVGLLDPEEDNAFETGQRFTADAEPSRACKDCTAESANPLRSRSDRSSAGESDGRSRAIDAAFEATPLRLEQCVEAIDAALASGGVVTVERADEAYRQGREHEAYDWHEAEAEHGADRLATGLPRTTQCPKCGSDRLSLRWMPYRDLPAICPRPTDANGHDGEHIHVRCQTCHYQWPEPCADGDGDD